MLLTHALRAAQQPGGSGGALYTWGGNAYGMLGLGDTASRLSPTQVGSLSDWASVCMYNQNTSAVKTDGTLWTWGVNSQGALGIGTGFGTDKSSPVQVGSLTNWMPGGLGGAIEITYAIKTDGTLWAWGYNAFGQLGNNSTQNTSSPIQVGFETDWTFITGGSYYALGIRFNSGNNTLYAWGGAQNSGCLGTSSRTDRSQPASIGNGYAYAAAGNTNSYAITTGGRLYAWGDNWIGQLGTNNLINRSTPTAVGTLTNWAKVGAGQSHAAAVKTDGTLWVWGNGANGRLGTGNNTNRSSPVQVGSLTNWANVWGGDQCTIALKTDGTMWAWGRNAPGLSGDTNSPVQIGSLPTVGANMSINAYSGSACGITI
jgi:alpha-tubulin suppressor-like RCC1 family protein